MAREIPLTFLLFVISIIPHSDEKPAMWAVLLWETMLYIYDYDGRSILFVSIWDVAVSASESLYGN